MADKNIGVLPAASSLDDDSLLVAEQQGEAVSVSGALFKQFAQDSVAAQVSEAQGYAEQAEEAAASVQSVAEEAATASAAMEAAQAAQAAAESAQNAAEAAKESAETAASTAATDVESALQTYAEEAEQAKNDAQAAASTAASNVEAALQGYVSDAEQARDDAESAASTAADDVKNALQSYVSDAQSAAASASTYSDEAEKAAEEAASKTAEELRAEFTELANTATAAAERAEESADSVDTSVLQATIEGKGDNLEFDSETSLLWLTSSGERIGDGITVATSTGLDDRVETLESQMAELLYTAIAISSFSHNAGTKEMGSTLSSVKLTWATNKTPTALTLDGTAIDASLTSTTLSSLSITATKTWTLKATDERDATATKTTTVYFYNGVYYGAAAVPDTLDSAFILGLSKKLSSGKYSPVTVDVADGEYAWYCLPTRMGTCTFTVGGFEGGFDLVDTISFTNASGYTENYYVYRSSNPSLGSTKVVVT